MLVFSSWGQTPCDWFTLVNAVNRELGAALKGPHAAFEMGQSSSPARRSCAAAGASSAELFSLLAPLLLFSFSCHTGLVDRGKLLPAELVAGGGFGALAAVGRWRLGLEEAPLSSRRGPG